MKKQLLQLLLVPTLVCTILGVGFLSTTGLAHAATFQASAPQVVQPAYNPGRNCTFGNAEIDDEAHNVFCFETKGAYPGEFNDIYILNTGSHTVTWDWLDTHGGRHHSSKPPHTIVTAANSPGGFAGNSAMFGVFNIVLS